MSRVFQEWFKGVSRKIEECFKGISSGVQGYLKENQSKFQGSCKGVSRKEVSRVFQFNFKWHSSLFDRSSKGV